MLENPSQGIRNYSIGDVFTPDDANARRERIHFDFVITEEQFQRYKANHSDARIDIGDVILSEEDGSDGPGLSFPLDHPITIYIDATTTESDILDFANGRFLGDDQIFPQEVISAWTAGYGGGILVHLYTRCPYSIYTDNLCGGIAYHTTSQAYVNLIPAEGSGGWYGVCLLGTFQIQGGEVFNTYKRPGYVGPNSGLTIIYERCLEGRLTWEEDPPSMQPADNTIPGVIQAAWQSAYIVSEIQIPVGLTHWYGTYARCHEAYTCNDGHVIVRVISGDKEEILSLASISGSAAQGTGVMVFQGGSLELHVKDTDDLVWKAAGSSAKAPGPVIIRDIDIPSKSGAVTVGDTLVNFDVLNGAVGSDARLTICQDGEFRTIAKTGSDATSWEFSSLGPNYEHFDFKDSTRLEWYTWYKYHWEGLAGSTPVTINEANRKTELMISADKLAEGLVYEVAINVCALGDNARCCVASGAMNFQVSFYDDAGSNSPSTVIPCRWAESQSAGAYFIKPAFMLNVEATNESANPPAPMYRSNAAPSQGIPNQVLARAVIHFAKIAGTIYVMSY